MVESGKVIEHESFYKKIRPIIYILGAPLIIGSVVVWLKELLLGIILALFLIICACFVAFKTIKYMVKFGFLVVKLGLSILAMIFALGGGLFILNLFN